ncbi:MAG: GUN4 domain-containing protein [Oscillatoriaceae cyanobacterium Prado104]|nr:GUN4 domain-containing protein [Oscillatoriaceae cyanobacterium Prado104]
MKSRSCWLIFTLIGLSLTSCSQQKSSQEIAETVKNSIVLISYQNEAGHGTGFIVPGPAGVCTVLTARHVVAGRSLNLQTNDQKLHQTDSIQASPNLDLAVVTFQSAGEKCPYPSLNLGDSDSVKQTDQIYISGFPDRAGGGKLVRQFVRGFVSGLDVLEQGYGISYDASTYGGMSGGPVLDTSGKVVAVHGKTDAQIVADLQSQQASLSPQQQAALQQAAARVAGGGVQVNTFRWGIPIKTYLANQSWENQPFAKADYTKLRELLAAGQWRAADEETASKMVEVAGRQKERRLTQEDMENFSCPDLRAMDRLWVKYSNGRFGFSVQKRIYQSLGGTKEYNREVWLAFSDKTSFVTANEIKATYNINAPEGHLPWYFWLTPSSAAIMPRILNCNL